MPGADLVARVAQRARAPIVSTGSSRDGVLSLDEWASMFSYGGLNYPLLQTTMGAVDRERILGTTVASLKGNTTIAALILARVQAFSQVTFQWSRFSGSKPGDLFDTDDLKVLETPWPGGSTAALLAKMEVDNCLTGNGYVVRPRPGRLARLRPDLTTICLGSQMDYDCPADAPDVEVAGYAYFPRSGKPQFFWPDEVAHYAPMPDPDFAFLGMSWITSALREVQADSLATEHKYRFFANAATPNLAIKFDPTLDIEYVKQFKALLENEHKGAFNAYKTLYLGGGAEPIAVGKDFQQLAFAETQGKGEARLASAAGVPASWVGFSEGLQGSALNAGNFSAQRRRFSDGTMYHLWMMAANALQAIVSPSGKARGARLWFDSRVPFMREDAQDIAQIQFQQAQAISQLVMQGYDPDSVVKAINEDDMSLLKHTGMTSVQLHKPGAEPPVTAGANVGQNGNGDNGSTVVVAGNGDSTGGPAGAGPNGNKPAAAGASGGSSS